MAKKYEELTFTDDFMFCKVLTTDLELCRDILQLLLDIPIREVRLSESQKAIEITSEGRGIRLDVYVEDENNTVFDLEMQTSVRDDLPKRSRYYQGMIDLDMIERGALFRQLRRSYVIFICLEDVFGAGLPIYTFENTCKQEPGIRLNDETLKVFINASAESTDIPADIRQFFDYLLTQKATDNLTARIAENVRQVRSNEKWRVEYMTLQMKYNEIREEGKAEGRAEGVIATLYNLIQDGILTVEEAASRAGMSVADFLKAGEVAGINHH